MAQNLCTPASTYGPFNQTLFLGVSVVSFDISLGWNTTSSTLTIQLIEDDCSGTKDYWDKNLNKKTWSGADPGFTEPALGSAVYFRVGDFEFAGLLQSWVANRNKSGRPTYTVKVVDPREILQDAQFIIDNYAGPINDGTYNLINVFGYMESFGVACPAVTVNGANFGTLAGGFGGSGVNDRGIEWNRFLAAIRILTSSLPRIVNAWSRFGRLAFRTAIPSRQGYGVMAHDLYDVRIPVNFTHQSGYLATYLLDLSDIPVTSSLIRLSGNGTHISAMDMISEIAEQAGCDYYVELIPMKLGGSIHKIIKVRTVLRANEPNLGAVQDFINSVDLAYPAKGTTSSSYGRELRQEKNSSFLIGNNQRNIYQVTQDTDPEGDGPPTYAGDDDMIRPYFGTDENGNVRSVYEAADGWRVIVDISKINDQLVTPLSNTVIEIRLLELRAIRTGQGAWIARLFDGNSPLGIAFAAVNGPQAGIWRAANETPGEFALAFVRDLFNWNRAGAAANGPQAALSAIRGDLTILFAFLKPLTDNVIGDVFAVRLPYSCVKREPESNNIIFAEQPTDMGWTEATDVLGLPNPSIWMRPFTSDNNMIGPIVKTSSWHGENIVRDATTVYDGSFYASCTVESEVQFLDRSTLSVPLAIIHTILWGDMNGWQENAWIIQWNDIIGAGDINKAEEIIQKAGGNAAFNRSESWVDIPDAVAIPLKSNITTYGPWWNNGPPGGVLVKRNDNMVPWNYGGIANLDEAALADVNTSVTRTQLVEMGTIEVPGYPTLPLGAEIGASAIFGGSNLVDTRNLLTGNIEDKKFDGTDVKISYGGFDALQWKGIYGPNITNISVSVGPNGITTSYRFRTYTPVLGRFKKQTLEQLRRIREEQNKLNKSITSQNYNSFTSGKKNQELQAENKSSRSDIKQELRDAREKGFWNIADPVGVIVGQNSVRNRGTPLSVGSANRSMVVAQADGNIFWELTANYANKAFMSWDGLIRPVSIDGDAGLPQFANTVAPCDNSANSPNAQPPVSGQGSSEIYKLDVSSTYLNPLTNPAGKLNSSKHGTSVGHDFDIIARDTGVPVSSISMVVDEAAGADAYKDDYRFFGLRGPLVIHGWGYDTDGKPIPNQADTEASASGGVFTSTALQDTFMDDWLQKSHTWPVAPVDLRFDRRRGVWVSPPPYKMLTVQLLEDLKPNSNAEAIQIFGLDVYDSGGTTLTPSTDQATAPRLRVYDVLGKTITSGNRLVAYYDTDQCKYMPVDDAKGGVDVANSSDYCTANMTPVGGTPTGISTIFAGEGVRFYRSPSNSDATFLGMDLKLNKATSTSIGSCLPSGSGISTLCLGQGLVIRDILDCTALIEATGVGGSGIIIENTSYCWNEGSDWREPGVEYNTDKLSFGGGLMAFADTSVGERANAYVVTLDISTYSTPTNRGGDEALDFAFVKQGVDSLYFGSGISIRPVSSGDDCGIIIDVVSSGSGDGKVKVNSGDTLDYLEDQFDYETINDYDAITDIQINTYSTTGSDPKVRPYAAMDSVVGYGGVSPNTLQFFMNNETIKWITPLNFDSSTKQRLEHNAGQLKWETSVTEDIDVITNIKYNNGQIEGYIKRIRTQVLSDQGWSPLIITPESVVVDEVLIDTATYTFKQHEVALTVLNERDEGWQDFHVGEPCT